MRKSQGLVKVVAVAIGLLCANGINAQPSKMQNDASEQQEAVQRLTQFEKEFGDTSDPSLRFYLLSKLAPTAYTAGDQKKARDYATALLKTATDFPKDWNYGNAVHVGNLVLGRLALDSGEIAEADRYLLQAGNTPGSPQLNSFGPNMILAKELLERGERDAVLQYFQLCARFWELSNGKLDEWTATVKGGGTPKFGANLLYGIKFNR
jgi:hypothetical protein